VKNQQLVLFILLFMAQMTVCGDFVCEAQQAERNGEVEIQLKIARWELSSQKTMKSIADYKKLKNAYRIYEAIYTIEQGLERKEKWHKEEVEALFNSLFSAKFPNERIDKNSSGLND